MANKQSSTVTIVVALIGAAATIIAAFIAHSVGESKAKDELKRRFAVQVFSSADKSGIGSANVQLGGTSVNAENTDSAGTAMFIIPQDDIGKQGSLTVSARGFKRFTDNTVILQPTKSAHGVYLEPETNQNVVSSAADASSSLPERMMVPYSTGPKMSGSGKNFSDWYPACSGAAPGPGFRIVAGSDSFVLSGDRQCNAWSECQLVSRSPTQVCYRFRLQGHDEWPPPGQAASEGIVSVTWERPH